MRLIASLMFLACPAFACAQTVQYDGTAVDLDEGAVLYRESHFLNRAKDGSGERLVLYRCPDGTPFARKLITYKRNGLAPNFELIDKRLGYHEGVRDESGERKVFVQRNAEAATKSDALPDVEGLVADAGFDDFVRANWSALQAGETVRFPFLLPSKLDYYNFKVAKDHEDTVDGQPASVIRLSLGSWFAFVLPHMDVTYANSDQALLRFEGISNVRDEEGDNYKARIEFKPSESKPLDSAAVVAAQQIPLTSSCAKPG